MGGSYAYFVWLLLFSVKDDKNFNKIRIIDKTVESHFLTNTDIDTLTPEIVKHLVLILIQDLKSEILAEDLDTSLPRTPKVKV